MTVWWRRGSGVGRSGGRSMPDLMHEAREMWRFFSGSAPLAGALMDGSGRVFVFREGMWTWASSDSRRRIDLAPRAVAASLCPDLAPEFQRIWNEEDEATEGMKR